MIKPIKYHQFQFSNKKCLKIQDQVVCELILTKYEKAITSCKLWKKLKTSSMLLPSRRTI